MFRPRHAIHLFADEDVRHFLLLLTISLFIVLLRHSYAIFANTWSVLIIFNSVCTMESEISMVHAGMRKELLSQNLNISDYVLAFE